MKPSPGLNELQQGTQEWSRFYQRLGQQRMSRRIVMKLGTLAALGGVSGVTEFLAACAEEEKKAAETGTPTAGTGTPFAGVTGDWDTTGTPPYRFGLPDDVAKIPDKWKQYPWQYKYSAQWRYNWNIPVTRGGHVLTAAAPPANYDFMTVSTTDAQPFNNKLYNGAIREGANLMTPAVEPELAIKEEHNADYTSWTFTIPEGVKFHNIAPVNGRLMTIEDVAFSFERHRDSNVFKSILRHVEKITAVDKTHVRFDLKRPVLTFPSLLATPNFVVFAKEHFENQDLFKKQPIGTGPFILEFSEFQNKSVLVRNPAYWEPHPLGGKYGNEPLPFVDKITKQFFANIVAAKEAFFAGNVDWFPAGCGLDPPQVKEILQRIPDARVNTNAYWSCCPQTFMFNFRNPLFKDIRVRKALSMGLDREQIWSGGMGKTGAIGGSVVPFDLYVEDYFPTTLKELGPNVQYNPEQAKALLREAGLTLPLKLKVYLSPSLQLNSSWQGAVDAGVFNWRQAGVVDAEVIARDLQVYNQDQLNGTWPDLLWSTTITRGYTLDATIAPAFLSGSPANYGAVDDPALTDLMEKAALATNPDDVRKLGRQIAQQVVDNVDHIYFAWWGGVNIEQPWMHGFAISNHNCIDAIGKGNFKYIWIDQTAPEGRGGKPI